MKYRAFFEKVSGLRMSARQAAYGAVMFDGCQPGELDEELRSIAYEIFGPVEEYPAEVRSVGATLKGARIGGTMMWVYHLFLGGLTIPVTGLLAPGEPLYCVIVASKLKAARHALRYVFGIVDAHPEFQGMVEERTRDSISIRRSDGVLVIFEAVAAGRAGENLRSRTLAYVLIDEGAFLFDESSQRVVTIEELFRAAHARLIPDSRARRGAQLGIVSTVWTADGYLWELVQRNRVQFPSECIAALCPTLFMLDTERNRHAYELARAADEANAEREYNCVPLAMSSDRFLPSVSIDAALDDTLDVALAPGLGDAVLIGGDLAQVNDASAFCVLHVSRRAIRVAEVLELRPRKGKPIPLADICASAAELAKRHRTSRVYVDHHLLTVARELMPPGVSLLPGPGGQSGKFETYQKAKELLVSGTVRIPSALARLANQLREIRSKPSPSGLLTFTSPRRPGEHGDLASSFILACWAASRIIKASRPRDPAEREPRERILTQERAKDLRF